jgi:N-acetylmuramoyl-L-alanine amidase
MAFTVKNNLLFRDGNQVKHFNTTKTSGKRKFPISYIVIHYTAGITFESDIRTLSSDQNVQSSCQLVVSKEGEVVQISDFSEILWHAGKSSWNGIEGLNSYSIGIEVTNPGFVDFAYEKDGISYYKYPGSSTVKWNDRDDKINFVAHKNGGPKKYWVEFSKAQMEALYGIVKALKEAYPIKEVVGHDMIAPLRKCDPGPCLPDDFYSNVNGTKASQNDYSNEENVLTTTANLNLRFDPSTNSSIIKTLSKGTKVSKIRDVDSTWTQIKTGDSIGFVSSKYLQS